MTLLYPRDSRTIRRLSPIILPAPKPPVEKMAGKQKGTVAREEDEGIAFALKCLWLAPKHPCLYFMAHAANGGHRGKREAASLVMQGVNPGNPDYFLPDPRGGYPGWYGELKRTDATPCAVEGDQRLWASWLADRGYWYGWHSGADAMWDDLMQYLALPPA